MKTTTEQPTDVITAMILLHVQSGLQADDPEVRAAAESVLSALVLHLRKQKARLKPEMARRLVLLREHFEGKKALARGQEPR